MNRERLRDLTRAYLMDTLSASEGKELATLLLQPEFQAFFMDDLHESLQGDILTMDNPEIGHLEQMTGLIQQRVRNIAREESESNAIQPSVISHRVQFLRRAWLRYAAIFILIAGSAILILINGRQSGHKSLQTAIEKSKDVAPGGNRATLTLADGSTIMLDSASTGSLASQGTTQIIKLNGGALAYTAGSGSPAAGYNTIRTPKGGQYQVVLPDGSKVWLNAASSVRFKTAFTGERKVEVTGEAYFEIAADAHKPFSVSVHDALINVLGTSFNINAYTDEPAVAVTLLQGLVRVNAYQHTQMLKPGQQALMETDAQRIRLVANPGMEQIMAWQHGAFSFHNTDLAVVMRQLSRWYDIEVVYENKPINEKISGEIGRDLNLSEVVKVLTGLGINAIMKNNTLIIGPKKGA